MLIESRLMDCLPHRPPMVMLERMEEVSEDTIRCGVTVGRGVPFADAEGNLPGWAGIELMAQSIAAWSGYRDRAAGRSPSVGWLVGVHAYLCAAPRFPTGANLQILSKRSTQIDRMGSFNCEIHQNGSVVASAQVTVYLPDAAELKGETVPPGGPDRCTVRTGAPNVRY